VCIRTSVHAHTSKTTCPNFTKFSVRVTCGPSSILLQYRAISCVYFRLRMTSSFYIMGPTGQNQRRRTLCLVKFARWRHQSAAAPRARWRSVLSLVALFANGDWSNLENYSGSFVRSFVCSFFAGKGPAYSGPQR